MQKIAHCANFCIASFGVIHPPDRYRIPGVYTSMHGGNDSNLLIVFYVQIMPDDFVMQLHR
ncbi:hypothetical protein, partial [Escherichia coli]|uniref:hypothetical protein n=1 Tax=Escherichia coli TaxID=562 RepID=UPI001FCEDC3B